MSIFDNLDALRVTQSDELQVERLIVSLPVRRPDKADFIPTHSLPFDAVRNAADRVIDKLSRRRS